MQNKSSKSGFYFKVSLIAVVASAILTASVMTGCGGKKKDVKATEVVHETQISTYEVNGITVDESGNVLDKNGKATGETVAVDKDGNILDEQGATTGATLPKSKADNKQSSAQSSNAQSSSKQSSSKQSSSKQSSSKQSGAQDVAGNQKSSSKQSSSTQSSSKQSSSKQSSSAQKSEAGSGSLKIGSKRYNVGDTVVCTYNLQAPEKLLNFQGGIKYDGKYLKVKSARLENSAGNSGMLNYNLNQEILFNGSNLNGYNYTSDRAFLTVEYEVIGAGSTTPKTNWVVITGLSEKKYCDDNGNLINGIKVSTNYK